MKQFIEVKKQISLILHFLIICNRVYISSYLAGFDWGKQEVQVALEVGLGVLTGWGGEDFAKLVEVNHRICVTGDNAAVSFENKVFDQFDAAEGVGVLAVDRRLSLIKPELCVNEVIIADKTVCLFYGLL